MGTSSTEIQRRGAGIRSGGARRKERKKHNMAYGGGWGKNRGACGNGEVRRIKMVVQRAEVGWSNNMKKGCCSPNPFLLKRETTKVPYFPLTHEPNTSHNHHQRRTHSGGPGTLTTTPTTTHRRHISFFLSSNDVFLLAWPHDGADPAHGCVALPAEDYVNDSNHRRRPCRRTFVSKP